MKIRKVSDKSMEFHTKADIKLHVHQNKEVIIKKQNVSTVNRSPRIKSVQSISSEAKNQGKQKYRNSTVQQYKNKHTGVIDTYRRNREESKKSIKAKNSSIKFAGDLSTRTTINQMEGGEEVQQASMTAYNLGKPVRSSMSKGTELLRNSALEEKKRKIKKIESGSKLVKRKTKKNATNVANKTAKESGKALAEKIAKTTTKSTAKIALGATSKAAATGFVGPLAGIAAEKSVGWKMDKDDIKRTNRNRKIKFFMDKMKSQEEQTDSIGKMVKDLIIKRSGLVVKKIAAIVLPALLNLFLLMAIVCLPVILVVAVIYNSPFSIFFPPLTDGDTVRTVTSQYVAEFNQETSFLANNHSGYDKGEIAYVDYEGSYAIPSNYYDIICVYMVKFGVGDTATVMNDLSKQRLKGVFDDMCSYTTSTETETVENEDGTSSTKTILYINITLKTFRQMETEYHFSEDEIEILEEMMNPENLELIGYTGGIGGGGSGGANAVSTLSQAEINAILGGITDTKARQTCSFALSKVGYPYSQAYRNSGNYYDCSSLAYYSWKAAGVDISYNGSTTAAAEGHGLDEAGKTISFEELQPGDLIFYSYTKNRRYKNISHVAIYVGNGKAVEARNESVGVVFEDVSTDSIVMVSRP